MKSNFETVVIGGSQAGLSMGYYLAQERNDFVILEASQRIGDRWRNRYDSLHLFTPARFSRLAGRPFPGDPYHAPTKDEMADYLEAYAAEFQLPVLLNTHVDHLAWDGTQFHLTAGEREFQADQIVVATGGYQVPNMPSFASQLDPLIHQLHSYDYRNPATLPDGDVLVVGVGNSGAEIALELASSRKVLLSGTPPAMLPRPPHPILASVVFAVLHWVISRGNPIGRKLIEKLSTMGTPVEGTSEADFAKAGIERLPRMTGADRGKPTFADGTRRDVDAIVWATGYRLDFRWIDLPIFDDREGTPIHDRGVARHQPGLYFLGLPFQYAASSALIPGVSRDAKFLAQKISAHRASRADDKIPSGQVEDRPPRGTLPRQAGD